MNRKISFLKSGKIVIPLMLEKKLLLMDYAIMVYCTMKAEIHIPVMRRNYGQQLSERFFFLMKDPNSNPGEDYREWHWREITAKFFKVIFNWLQGLSEITPDYIPLLENDSYLDPANQVVLKYPLAIVNVIKISGSSSVLNNTLYDYAKRDAPFLRRQVRDILQPNIVVCGGGNGSVLDIAKQYIYPDLTFKPINNWCFFSEEQDLLLINSWHPAARISDAQKIDDMMRNVADFINKTQTSIFR